MKYQILLEDRKNGREALIECPANMPLEELSVKIKVELQLPYCDYNYHRFCYRGKTYVPAEHTMSEEEIYWECTGYYYGGFRSSLYTRLKNAFTVRGSAINYFQDDESCRNRYKVRCTLLDIIE